MIIEIERSVIEYIAANYDSLNFSSSCIMGINKLAMAYHSKYHMIIGELDVLEYFSCCDLLDRTTIQLFTYLKSKFYEIGETCYNIKNRILIHMRNEEIENSNGVYFIKLTSLDSILKTRLISENIQDCEFYLSLYNSCRTAISKQNQYFDINLHPISCSGSDSLRVGRNEISQGAFVLLIMDSDMDHPLSNVGSSLTIARRFYNQYKKQNSLLLHELKVHEKENLISPSLRLLTINPQDKKYLEYLSMLENDEESNQKLKYFDFKEGINAGKYRTANKDWLSFYVDFFDFLKKGGYIHADLDNLSEDSEHIIATGVSNGSLNDFKDQILDKGVVKLLIEKKVALAEGCDIPEYVFDNLEQRIEISNDIFSFVPQYLKEDWMNIIDLLHEFGCSPNESMMIFHK